MAKKQLIKTKSTKKTVVAKQVPTGRVYVTATFNNTLVTLTDHQGNTLGWSSSGAGGFKGARKATPFAAITAVEKVAEKAKSLGMTAAEIYIKGPGSGRDAAIRALRNTGLNIIMIADVTPVPFGGPRAKKKRRV
ncbi:MAG: 30S ribosomal protein S11 [Patescibacteria group bacterium]|nr:30S ribosomal protein S11 [Patescibacteria group bacterium]